MMIVTAASYCIGPCNLSTTMHIICVKSSVLKTSNRRLLSRFRTGCHGLRVDTGRWENNVHLDRKDRLCLVCSSAQQVEDEHHLLFDSPAYSSIRASHANLFQCACSVSDFFDSCEANACGGFYYELFFPKEQCFDWMNINRTLSVGPQLVPRTLNKHTYIHTLFFFFFK